MCTKGDALTTILFSWEYVLGNIYLQILDGLTSAMFSDWVETV
jgi:hypothetical protein